MEKVNIILLILKFTQYSICEGAVKIDELAEYCKKNKIRAVGMYSTYVSSRIC